MPKEKQQRIDSTSLRHPWQGRMTRGWEDVNRAERPFCAKARNVRKLNYIFRKQPRIPFHMLTKCNGVGWGQKMQDKPASQAGADHQRTYFHLITQTNSNHLKQPCRTEDHLSRLYIRWRGGFLRERIWVRERENISDRRPRFKPQVTDEHTNKPFC